MVSLLLKQRVRRHFACAGNVQRKGTKSFVVVIRGPQITHQFRCADDGGNSPERNEAQTQVPDVPAYGKTEVANKAQETDLGHGSILLLVVKMGAGKRTGGKNGWKVVI